MVHTAPPLSIYPTTFSVVSDFSLVAPCLAQGIKAGNSASVSIDDTRFSCSARDLMRKFQNMEREAIAPERSSQLSPPSSMKKSISISHISLAARVSTPSLPHSPPPSPSLPHSPPSPSFPCFFIHLLPPTLTQSHSLTHTHSLTHSHSLTLTHSHSLKHSLFHSHSLTLILTHSHSLTCSPTHQFAYSLTPFSLIFPLLFGHVLYLSCSQVW